MGKLKVRYDCFCSEDVKIRNKRKAGRIAEGDGPETGGGRNVL